MIATKNGVDNAAAGVDAILKKRYDLIPNLIAAVEAYMRHERSLLEGLTQLRTQALASTGEERRKLDREFTKQLGGLFVAAENYPDLKANQNFLQLQAALNEVEEQISAARRAFNAAVTDYNNSLEMFPSSVLARRMNFQRKALFEIAPQERKSIDVAQLLDR
ncbi:LemA family protein [compost metagenome]